MLGSGARYLIAESSLRLLRELDTPIASHGRPTMCVSDNGTELTGMAILRRSQEMRSNGITSRLESRSKNAIVESFKDGRAMNCLTRHCSPRSPMCAGSGDLEGRLQHHQTAQRTRQPAANGFAKLSAPAMRLADASATQRLGKWS